MRQTKKKNGTGIEKLKASVWAYIGYSVEYPGIFDLFYLAKGGDFGNKKTILEVIGFSLDEVCEKEYDYCLAHRLLSAEEIVKQANELRRLCLLLYW